MPPDICEADENVHVKTVKDESKMISASLYDLTQETCDGIPLHTFIHSKKIIHSIDG
jgi:hypothetical protein